MYTFILYTVHLRLIDSYRLQYQICHTKKNKIKYDIYVHKIYFNIISSQVLKKKLFYLPTFIIFIYNIDSSCYGRIRIINHVDISIYLILKHLNYNNNYYF